MIPKDWRIHGIMSVFCVVMKIMDVKNGICNA